MGTASNPDAARRDRVESTSGRYKKHLLHARYGFLAYFPEPELMTFLWVLTLWRPQVVRARNIWVSGTLKQLSSLGDQLDEPSITPEGQLIIRKVELCSRAFSLARFFALTSGIFTVSDPGRQGGRYGWGHRGSSAVQSIAWAKQYRYMYQ